MAPRARGSFPRQPLLLGHSQAMTWRRPGGHGGYHLAMASSEVSDHWAMTTMVRDLFGGHGE